MTPSLPSSSAFGPTITPVGLERERERGKRDHIVNRSLSVHDVIHFLIRASTDVQLLRDDDHYEHLFSGSTTTTTAAAPDLSAADDDADGAHANVWRPKHRVSVVPNAGALVYVSVGFFFEFGFD